MKDPQRFKITEWRKLALVSQATATAPQVRQDANGRRWAWKSAGQYVYATRA